MTRNQRLTMGPEIHQFFFTTVSKTVTIRNHPNSGQCEITLRFALTHVDTQGQETAAAKKLVNGCRGTRLRIAHQCTMKVITAYKRSTKKFSASTSVE